jgi:hypothetical protein
MLIRAEDEDGRPTNHVCCDAPASIHPADVSARCIQPPRIHPTLLPPTRPLRVSHVHSHSFAYKQSFQCKSGDARSCLKSCSCNTFSRHYHGNATSLEAVCVYVPRMTAHQCRRHIMLHEHRLTIHVALSPVLQPHVGLSNLAETKPYCTVGLLSPWHTLDIARCKTFTPDLLGRSFVPTVAT